jgi:hypothetical protein
MIPLLIDACPSYLFTWEFLDRERRGASDDEVHDRAVAGLARHLRRMSRKSGSEGLAGALAIVERLLCEGNRDVQKSVDYLLRTLQDDNCEPVKADIRRLRDLMGPRSAQKWDDFEKYCEATQKILQWRRASPSARFPHIDLNSISDSRLRRELREFCEIFKPRPWRSP